MLSIGRICPAAACCSPSSASIIVRVVQRSRSGHPATRRATRTCVSANPENVGRVDHPEHHAQARPKCNGGSKLILQVGAPARKKERTGPGVLLFAFFWWGG